MARSESNPIAGKQTYPDLNLTQYPDNIDSRANNANMKGFENLKDYNMAEHVNALEDAVMAIQRALGIKPFVNKDGVSKNTVSARIVDLENRDYDPRYGGAGWIASQTLVGHTHTGTAGHPAQVNLASETQGVLPKSKLNFNAASDGITGADLALSTTDTRKIPDVVNDKLSVSQGGTIQKNLVVQGQLQTRFMKEYDADTAGGALITDYSTMSNKARRAEGTGQVEFLWGDIPNLNYGKYVLGVRARVSALVNEEVLHLRMYNVYNDGYRLQNYLYIRGTDFDAPWQWKTFYLTFNNMSDRSATTGPHTHVWKCVTSSNIILDFDNAFIMPTHPAIYDK